MNLLEMLNDQIGDQLSKHASGFLGESPDNVSNALGGIFPSILGKVADIAQSGDGAKSILDMAKGADDSILDDIGGLFGGGVDSVNNVLGSGSGMVNAIFGGGLGSIIDKVAGLSGLKKSSSSSLIKMAAPFLMGMVKRAVMQKGLDAVGLGKLMGNQRSFVDKLLPAGLGSVLGLAKNVMGGTVDAASNVVGGTVDAGKKVVGGTVDAAKNVAGATMDTGKKVVGGAANVAGAAVDTGAKAGKSILKWLLPLLLALLALGFLGRQGCSTGIDAVDNAAAKTMNATEGAVNKTADMAGDAAGAVGDVAKKGANAVGDAAGAVGNAAGNVVDATGNVVKGAAGAVASAFGNVNEAAAKALNTVKFEAGSAGSNMMSYIKGGFKGDGKFRIKNGNFATGSDVLTAETKRELNNLTAILNAYPDVNLNVSGFTDSTGDAGKNLDLSDRRAKSVKAYLVTKGIAGKRVAAKGFGAANPVASNDTPEGRAENRRIELSVR